MEADSIGNRILAVRKEFGMKQSELAAKAGLTQACISQIESGLRNPDTNTLLSISTALGISVDDLTKSSVRDTAIAALEAKLRRPHVSIETINAIHALILTY